MAEMTIHQAAAKGDLERVCEVVQQIPCAFDYDDQYGWRPIFHAGLHKRLEVVPCRIDQGCDLAVVFPAIKSRVAGMLKRDAWLTTMPDGRGDQPIHHAARNGDVGVMKLLLDRGVDLEYSSCLSRMGRSVCRQRRPYPRNDNAGRGFVEMKRVNLLLQRLNKEIK
jgi:ankyrin repeat protein